MNTKLTTVLLVLGMAFAIGCRSELDNKPAALVSSAQAAEPAAQKLAPAARVTAIAVDKSSIGWVGAKLTGDHKGGFNAWSGKVHRVGAQVNKVEFEVDTTSVFSDNEKLTGHLKSEDFFDVENHPKANFVSRRIEAKAGQGSTHVVTGDLTLRGITRELSFPATIKTSADQSLRASAEFTFNRLDFDIKYAGMPDDLIKKEVLLKLDFVAP
ncbi:MAG: YceI family protein [Bradymonadaceae bacterium]|nr:YceI family protein [Lujinxingiaceae bacterium]